MTSTRMTPSPLCECGHAAARHDRISFKDGRAPTYPCLEPDCSCAELMRVDDGFDGSEFVGL